MTRARGIPGLSIRSSGTTHLSGSVSEPGAAEAEDFQLYEGLLWRPGEGYFLLEQHLSRLQRSAAHFAFPLDREETWSATPEQPDRIAELSALLTEISALEWDAASAPLQITP